MTTEDPIRIDLLPGDYQNGSSGERDDAALATTVPNAALAALGKTISSTVLNLTLASAEGHASAVTNPIEVNEAEGAEEGDDRSESSETLSSDAPRRSSSAIERARSANQSAFKSALRNSTSTVVLEGRTGEGDDPVILTCDLYVKKTGLTNTRYAKHFCTLSYAEGVDGGTGCRLSYQESQCIVREIVIVRMDGEVAARLEFTIISDEDQTYTVRAFLRAEFEQWTDAIKKSVPPPLSSKEAEGSALKRTSSLLSRKSSTATSTALLIAEGGVCVGLRRGLSY